MGVVSYGQPILPGVAKDYDALANSTNEQLLARGTLVTNLVCAQGLVGVRGDFIERSRTTLTEWVQRVRSQTKKWLPRFRRNRAEHWNSEAKFRMLAMATVLQRELGVHYSEPHKTGEYDARDSRFIFIHGPLAGDGGTCANLPVLYLAVGRELGYPLYLAQAREHLFVRWEGKGERFNIEATCVGFSPYDDAHYHHFPRPLSAEELASGQFLRNLTPREELAVYFTHRGSCLLDNLRTQEAVQAFHLAHQIGPAVPGTRGQWATATLFHELISNIQSQKLLGVIPLSEALMHAKPKIDEEWKRVVFPQMMREFHRIQSLGKLRPSAEAVDEVFSCGEVF